MRKIALLLGLIIAIFLLAGCKSAVEESLAEPRDSDEDALHPAAEEARADLVQVPEGYSLTATVNHLESADIEFKEFNKKPGIRTQTKYVKKGNSRLDILFENKEKRQYRIAEGNSLTVHACEKENEKWVCDKVDSTPDVPEDLEAGIPAEFAWEQVSGGNVEQISYRKIAGIKAKCFSYQDGSINCYHPTALILLYQEMAGFNRHRQHRTI